MSKAVNELVGKSAVVRRGSDFYSGLFEQTPSGYALSHPVHAGYEAPTRLERLTKPRMALQPGDMVAARGRIFYLTLSNELSETLKVMVKGTDQDVYFTGRAEDGEIMPVTIDLVSPYFQGAGMAYHVLDRFVEANPNLAKGIGVYRVMEARVEEVDRE